MGGEAGQGSRAAAAQLGRSLLTAEPAAGGSSRRPGLANSTANNAILLHQSSLKCATIAVRIRDSVPKPDAHKPPNNAAPLSPTWNTSHFFSNPLSVSL